MLESAAKEAIALLSTVIAEIFEDSDPALIGGLRGADWRARAAELQTVGSDVATLAAAIGVLVRRSEETRS